MMTKETKADLDPARAHFTLTVIYQHVNDTLDGGMPGSIGPYKDRKGVLGNLLLLLWKAIRTPSPC